MIIHPTSEMKLFTFELSGRPLTSFLVAGFLLIITYFPGHEHYYTIINWDLDHSWDVYSAYSHVTFVYTAFSCVHSPPSLITGWGIGNLEGGSKVSHPNFHIYHTSGIIIILMYLNYLNDTWLYSRDNYSASSYITHMKVVKVYY